MEDTQWAKSVIEEQVFDEIVLILVVMEDTQWGHPAWYYAPTHQGVLILVVMEDTQWVDRSGNYHFEKVES